MFSLWSINYSDEIPMVIIQAFKKGLELKSATPSVRICYLQWLLSCLENGKLSNGVDLTESLLKIVEKASQNTNQITLLSEAVCAVCLLLKTSQANNKLNNLMNIILDMNKQVFLTEKFIQTAPVDTLCYIMLMCKILILEYDNKLKGPPEPLYRCIIYCCNSISKKVRAYCLQHLKALVDSTNGINIITNLFVELTKYIQSNKIHVDGDNNIEENSVPAEAIIDTILILCSIKNVTKSDAQIIALNCLLCCHHTALVIQVPNLFENVLNQLNLESNSFISLNTEQIRNRIIDEYKPIPIYENTVSTLCKLCPNIVLPILIAQIVQHLNNPNMSNVTDDEYFTYLTPNGELYDKTVIPNVEDIYKEISKKRENKTYSYKEQLEEIQIRREIEEKKRKEGK